MALLLRFVYLYWLNFLKLSFIFDKKYCYVTLTLIAIQVSIVYLLNKT